MTKVLFEIHYRYREDLELEDSYVDFNTREVIEKMLQDAGYDDLLQDLDDLVSGEISEIEFVRYGGSRDEPTGGLLRILTQAQAIAQESDEQEIERLKHEFDN